MLVLLPLLAFALLLLHFAPEQTADAGGRSWHGAFVRTCVAWGVWLALGSELLSLFDGLTRLGIAMLWLALCLGLLLIGRAWGAALDRWRRVVRAGASSLQSEKWALIGMGFVAGGLLLIAGVSPPNNADGLLYHMTRAVHWAQNGSLRHYPASWAAQLWSMPWAEMVILHLSQLWGGTAPANLVQWFSLLGCAVAAVGISSQLGAGRRGKLLAAAFIMSAPMAILQATSTQNDLVVAFWAAASVYLAVDILRSDSEWADWLALGGAAGLGMLTKVTFYPFLGPILFGVFISSLRRTANPAKTLSGWILAGLLAIALNLGIWSRNMQTFGTPLGSSQFVGKGLTMELDPRAPLSGALQHLALNVTLPSEGFQREYGDAVNAVSGWMGDRSQDFEALPIWNHGDTAGNPVHVAILGLAVGMAVVAPGRISKGQRWYAAALILSFLALAWTVDHGPYRVRYQLTLLAMGAPLVGSTAEEALGPRVRTGLTWGLLVLALPWLLFNRSRPLLSGGPYTRLGSVLREPSREVLFANFHKLEEPYSDAAAAIDAGECSAVGLDIDRGVPEYTLWWLLDAPWSGVEIRVIETEWPLNQRERGSFEPCAILCLDCGGPTELEGLPFQGQYERLSLFMR